MEQKTQESPQLRMTPEVAAAAIADRCRKDRDFMKNLCDDPKAALAKAGGKDMPDSMSVVVHQNSADHWHIVIPSDAQARRMEEAFKAVDGADDTLSDEQLQSLSGGEIFFTLTAMSASIGAVASGGSSIGTSAATAAATAVAAVALGTST